jgi:hypothetical protein
VTAFTALVALAAICHFADVVSHEFWNKTSLRHRLAFLAFYTGSSLAQLGYSLAPWLRARQVATLLTFISWMPVCHFQDHRCRLDGLITQIKFHIPCLQFALSHNRLHYICTIALVLLGTKNIYVFFHIRK